MFDEMKEELNHVTSWHWRLSIKVNKISLIIMTCFFLPICGIIFAFLVATDKWWVGTILLSIAVIGSIVVILLRKWLFKKYNQALNRENEQADKGGES